MEEVGGFERKVIAMNDPVVSESVSEVRENNVYEERERLIIPLISDLGILILVQSPLPFRHHSFG